MLPPASGRHHSAHCSLVKASQMALPNSEGLKMSNCSLEQRGAESDTARIPRPETRGADDGKSPSPRTRIR